MLNIGIIIRCILALMFCIIPPLVWSLKERKKSQVSFNMWQLGVVVAGILLIFEDNLCQEVDSIFVNYLTIMIDMIACFIMCSIINKMALSKQIGDAHTKVLSQSFFLSKICFTLLTIFFIVISRILTTMSSDFRTQTSEMLYAHEMYYLDLDMYINTVVLEAYNKQYSLAFVFELILTHLLACVSIMWGYNCKQKLPNLYKIIVLSSMMTTVTAYNLFLYNKTALTSISTMSFVTLGTLIIWWWFYEYDTPYRIMKK